MKVDQCYKIKQNYSLDRNKSSQLNNRNSNSVSKSMSLSKINKKKLHKNCIKCLLKCCKFKINITLRTENISNSFELISSASYFIPKINIKKTINLIKKKENEINFNSNNCLNFLNNINNNNIIIDNLNNEEKILNKILKFPIDNNNSLNYNNYNIYDNNDNNNNNNKNNNKNNYNEIFNLFDPHYKHFESNSFIIEFNINDKNLKEINKSFNEKNFYCYLNGFAHYNNDIFKNDIFFQLIPSQIIKSIQKKLEICSKNIDPNKTYFFTNINNNYNIAFTFYSNSKINYKHLQYNKILKNKFFLHKIFILFNIPKNLNKNMDDNNINEVNNLKKFSEDNISITQTTASDNNNEFNNINNNIKFNNNYMNLNINNNNNNFISNLSQSYNINFNIYNNYLINSFNHSFNNHNNHNINNNNSHFNNFLNQNIATNYFNSFNKYNTFQTFNNHNNNYKNNFSIDNNHNNRYNNFYSPILKVYNRPNLINKSYFYQNLNNNSNSYFPKKFLNINNNNNNYIKLNKNDKFSNVLFNKYKNNNNILCNYIIFKNFTTINNNKNNYTLNDYIKKFNIFSAFGIKIPIINNNSNIKFIKFTPSLSSCVLIIKKKEILEKIKDYIKNDNNFYNDNKNNFYELISEKINIKFDYNNFILEFNEIKPYYLRNTLEEEFQKIIEKFSFIKDLNLNDFDLESSFFSISFNEINSIKNNGSFINYYKLNSNLIGILPIKINKELWIKKISDNQQNDSNYNYEILINNDKNLVECFINILKNIFQNSSFNILNNSLDYESYNQNKLLN